MKASLSSSSSPSHLQRERGRERSAAAMLLPLLLFLLISAVHLAAGAITTVESSKTASFSNIYDLLRTHGLPIGLLPKGVTNFTFDSNGRFQVHLDQPCDAKFENVVRYDRNISGIVSDGQMGALSGISAQELFLWFPVKGIRVDIPSSGLIYFDVGVIYKQFSLSLFETPPNCVAVDEMEGAVDPLLEGKSMAEAVEKNKSGSLRDKLDEEHVQQAVM